MAKLSEADRDKLPAGKFAEPDKKAYPIEDTAHAWSCINSPPQVRLPTAMQLQLMTNAKSGKGGQPGLRLSQDQRVNIVGTFVCIHSFKVTHMTHHMIFI